MYSQIDANKKKTWLIMSLFLVVMGGLGWLAAMAYDDMGVFLVVMGVSLVYGLVQYFVAGRVALSMSGAREITQRDNPRFYNIVENLTIATGLPMPKVYIIDDPAPNAFATGRNPNVASVAATTGLIELMDDRELTGVMAHELAHVGNFDIQLSLVAFACTVMISFLADMLLRINFRSKRSRDDDSSVFLILMLIAAVLAPFAAAVIRLAVSRNREYLADSTAALTTRDPEALASALAKLKVAGRPLRKSSASMDNMYITSSLKKGFFSNLMSTHPPIEERIDRLAKMANQF